MTAPQLAASKKETVRPSRLRLMLSAGTLALALAVPFTVFWPAGRSFLYGTVPMYVTPGLYLSDFFVLVLLGAALGLFFTHQAATLRPAAWLAVPLCIPALLAGLGAFQAIAPGLAAYSALRWMLAAALFVALVQSRVRSEHLAAALLAGLAFQSVIGIAQFLHRAPLGLPGELALAVDQPRAAIIAVGGATWLRAYGLTFHPNLLGGYLAAGLVLSLPLVDRRLFRLGWWLCAVGLLVTFSRAAWLLAALMLPLAAAWLAWKRPALRHGLAWTLGLALLAGLGAGIAVARPLLARFDLLSSLSEFTSISARGELMQIAFDQIRAHPLLGIGAGNFPLAQSAYITLDPPHYVHHVALLLCAEVGLGGGLAWFWLWLAPGAALERVWKSQNMWIGVVTAAWFGWGIAGLWDSYPWALESGRLFSVFLLAWVARETISARAAPLA